jgi:ketosteroid isomerase-like protein
VKVGKNISMSPISNPSAQLSVVLRWYDAISNWKFDVLEELLSEDYLHETLPATANDPPKNKAEGIEHAKSVGNSLGYTPLQYEIFRLNETPGNIWLHSRLYGNVPGGIELNNESIFIFTLGSGDNIQITVIREFIDTKQAAEFAAAASKSAPVAPDEE